MKLFSVVGVRRAGKTTTIEALIQTFRARGYRVGTVKTIFCPVFSMDDPKSNTARHKAAGAEVVVARGNGETDISYPSTMEPNAIFEKVDVDILILEGDYESAVPRVVCAHTAEEVRERANAHTFVVSGRIADKEDSVEGYPAISAMADADALADCILEHLSDVTLPVAQEESTLAYTGICQCGCHKGDDALTAVVHPSGRKHLFLTGEKQVGKSTLLRKLREALAEEGQTLAGFLTLPYEIGGQRRGYYMHSLQPIDGFVNDVPVTVKQIEKGRMIGVTEAFNGFGGALVRKAKTNAKICIMDEIGKAEKDADAFQRAVFDTLDQAPLVLGVLQQCDADFPTAISKREDVTVWTVTEENREALFDAAIAYIKAQQKLWNRMSE